MEDLKSFQELFQVPNLFFVTAPDNQFHLGNSAKAQRSSCLYLLQAVDCCFNATAGINYYIGIDDGHFSRHLVRPIRIYDFCEPMRNYPLGFHYLSTYR